MFSHEHEVGIVESELHSSRLSSEGRCSSFLFYTTLSKPIQITLGLFLPMQRLILLQNQDTPLFHNPKCASRDAKHRITENDRSAKKTLHLPIKRNNAALFLLEPFIVEIFLAISEHSFFFVTTVKPSFPPTEAFNRT